MATVNNRTRIVQALAVNGVDAGGAMSIAVQAGYDNMMQSSPDGLGGPPLRDKEIEFVRGRFVTQDWVHFIELLTGTVGTKVFYERKSGVAAATGYIKHTITNPAVHRVELSLNQQGYMTISADFECRAADETEGFADMWTQTDDQAAPTYISAARGGYRVQTASFDPDGVASAISIYHVTAFTLAVAMMIYKACNDADVAYTCVDADEDGLSAGGSISFQDSTISTSLLLAQRLLAAGRGTLTLTVTQGGGATAKVITIAGVDPDNIDRNGGQNFTGHTLGFTVTNDTTTQLTLSGDNKLITIADAA